MIDALTGGTATGFLWWAIPLRIDLLYRSRICLLLAFGCNGAFGTAHEPGVGRDTGYGSGLLDGELERHKLPASALALVGFSQGTMMALHVGLRRATAPAAIVGYSGLLVTPPEHEVEAFAAEVKSRPPVLLVHGDSDDLIPVQAVFQAAQGLSALGLSAEWHISPGVGHGIDAEGLRHGGEFLARSFAASR